MEAVLYSTGELAPETPVHRIVYVLESRDIRPHMIVGGRKLFTQAQRDRVQSELKRIDEEREGDGG